MNRWFIPLTLMLVIAIAAGIVFIYFSISPARDKIAAVEDTLIEQECRAAWLSTRLDDGVAMIRYTLDDPPHNAGFYLRNRAESEAILLQQDGKLPVPPEIRIYRTGILGVSDSGSVSRIAERDGWELFEIVPPQHEPSVQRSAANEFHLRDGFTRVDFAKDDGWKILSGNWQLNKHGGGLPTTEEQFESAAFQRAVNPFSLLGCGDGVGGGILLYDAPGSRGESFLAEARFYIGQTGPQNSESVQDDPIPVFLIAQGELEGVQVAFGWWNAGQDSAPSWMLCRRSGDGPWETLASWQQRPPRTNWVRVGIAIHEGHIAAAYLDGHEIGTHDIGHIVSGPFHIHTGSARAFIELDDVLARPLTPAPGEELGEPVLVRSENFGEKALYDRQHDPAEFDYWARGENTFVISTANNENIGYGGQRAATRLPLAGDFTYRSTPNLPAGDYRFWLLKKHEPETADDILAQMMFTKSETGWEVDDGSFTLSFGRRGCEFQLFGRNGNKTIAANAGGAVYLAIAQPDQNFVADLHEIYSRNTWHELFEDAPSDWYWADGHFGMNSRWACQPGWNFMSGASPALAAVFSKTAYHGDQHIECFMSLRMTLPAEQHYYIRNSLCVSFCTDGVNLDSGYTLIFGGWRNSKTALFRRGEIVASTTEPGFLLPPGVEHGNIHWLWWNFEFIKQGNRVIVKYKGDTMFDFEDTEPLDGGQIAFWTAGNGFVVSRVTAVAQQRSDRSQAAHFDFAEHPNELPWKPLHPDAVLVRQEGDSVTATNPLGGGTFAVRTITEADLSQTPVLELPLRLDADAKVNLHLEIDGRPWIVQVSAPLDEMEYFLTPAADKAYPFGRPVMTSDQMKTHLLGEIEPKGGVIRIDVKQSLLALGASVEGTKTITFTVGNSSNAGYLLAGFGGNRAGTTYSVGKPTWHPAE